MKKILLLLFFIMLFTCSVAAESYEFDVEEQVTTEQQNLYEELYEGSDIDNINDAIPDNAKEFLFDLGIKPSDPFSLANITTKGAFGAAISYIKEFLLSPLKTGAVLLTIILICSILKGMGDSKLSQSNKMLNMTGTLVCITVVMIPITNLITKSGNALTSCGIFMLSFVPIFAGILIASLKAGTAAGSGSLLFIASQAITQIGTSIVAPFISMYLAICVAGSLSEESRLQGFVNIFKKTATCILTGAMTAFLGIISLQTAINGSTDSVVVKTAKFFAGAYIPVVGSVIGEALGSIQSCVGLIKSTVAIYGVIVLLIIFVPVLVEILLWKLTLSLCSAASEMFSLESITAVLKSINSALSILLSVVICAAIMFIFSITILALAGGGA